MVNIVGRRTVPQVFINGKHLGGSDGKSFLTRARMEFSWFPSNPVFLGISLLNLLIYCFVDTVEAYESGKLANLLGIETVANDDL